MQASLEIQRFEASPRATLLPVLVQLIGTGAIIVSGHVSSTRLLVVLTLSGVAAILLLVRSVLPNEAKAVLTVLVVLELAAAAANGDAFGLHGVSNEYDRAMTEAGEPLPRGPTPSGSGTDSSVSLHLEGGAESALTKQLSGDIDRSLDQVAPSLAITGKLSTSAAASGAQQYSLSWSVLQHDRRNWCGIISVEGKNRDAAVQQLISMVRTQVEIAPDKEKICG